MKQAHMRSICLLALVVVVMHVLAGCGNTDATPTFSQPTLAASNTTDTEQVTLRITGLS